MKRMRAAVIGCGRISVVYQDALKALVDDIEVVLAIDKVSERAETFAAAFPGCVARTISDPLPLPDLREWVKAWVEETRPDVVHVLTPHFLHHDHAIAFLEAGVHVLTEKPIALSLADADAMIAAANRAGRQLGVIFQNRYIAGVQEARRQLMSGQLGQVTGAYSTLNWHRPPSYYNCDWKGLWAKEGGGVVIDQAIHSIDLVRYLVGSEVASIKGHIDRRILTNIEVEDVADAAIAFENGVVYSFFACNYFTRNSDIQIELTCEKGTIRLEKDRVTIGYLDGSKQEILPGVQSEGSGESYWGLDHLNQIRDYYQKLSSGQPVPFDPSDAKKTLEVVLGIYQSAQENRMVYTHPANLLIIHGGGPTAVMNASLYGAITEARTSGQVSRIYGALGGTGGFLEEKLVDLTDIPEDQLSLLLTTPGSALGTSRDHLEPEDYDRIVELMQRHNIRYALFNGGNGTMDTCGKVYTRCQDKGIFVMGIPKTMDNDIAITDFCPGFGSAARYIATSVAEVCADVKGLPIHVVVIEASGRNAGWITAASALAKSPSCEGPDLIYLPERPFKEDEFLTDVQELIDKKKGVVVVVSEGLTDPEGQPIVDPIFQVGRATYFGDVSSHLANLVIKKLGYKARSEKPGLLGRASITLQSSVDREQAVIAGARAAKAVLAGESGQMVAFRRLSTTPFRYETFLVPIEQVMLEERTLPAEFINERGNGITDAFITWCQPLIGETLPEFIAFN